MVGMPSAPKVPAQKLPEIKVGDVVLERYRVLEQIGSDGHSVVFKGQDERLSRPVCIKVFSGLGGESGVGRTSYEHFVQEAFARLAKWMSANPVRQPGPYLQRIARNLLVDRARQSRSRPLSDYLPISDDLVLSVPPDQMHRLEANDVLEIYRRALDELPPRTREVFLLHRVDELTYKEIGARLEITEDQDSELYRLPDSDPRKPLVMAYLWLGGLQETLVETLMP